VASAQGGLLASCASQIPPQRLRQSNPTGKSPKVCPSLRAKIFRLTRRANQRYQLAPSHPVRGALRTSRTLRWDAVDATTASDERLMSRTAKSCGPDAPMLASSFREASFSGVKVARKPGHLGEREVSRKTTAQGKPVLLRFTCGPTPVLFVARGPRVQSAPGFPCALYVMRGWRMTQSSGTSCREDADLRLPRCLTCESKYHQAGARCLKTSS
jgi:hypothetical protein